MVVTQGIIEQYGTQIIAIIGTILGGIVLAVTNRLLDRTKQDRDEARNIREELRKDNASLREEIAALRTELTRVEQLEEARAVEINKMRVEHTILMQKFLKISSLYAAATNREPEFDLDAPTGTLRRAPQGDTMDDEG